MNIGKLRSIIVTLRTEPEDIVCKLFHLEECRRPQSLTTRPTWHDDKLRSTQGIRRSMYYSPPHLRGLVEEYSQVLKVLRSTDDVRVLDAIEQWDKEVSSRMEILEDPGRDAVLSPTDGNQSQILLDFAQEVNSLSFSLGIR